MDNMEKILIVDDEPLILEEMTETLNEAGYQAFSAVSVDRALELLNVNPEISLIITDLKMPGKTGIDLINDVNKNNIKSFQFVIITGHGSASMEGFNLISENHKFLLKPVDITLLLTTIESCLNGRGLGHE
jgi:DNA-binding NtrC family response regulator